jgi:hypothetical protein
MRKLENWLNTEATKAVEDHSHGRENDIGSSQFYLYFLRLQLRNQQLMKKQLTVRKRKTKLNGKAQSTKS